MYRCFTQAQGTIGCILVWHIAPRTICRRNWFACSPNPTVSAVDHSTFSGDGDDRLGALFDLHGSDKQANGYTPIYNFIFRSIGHSEITLLEIGLGTNDPAAISTMGSEGRPGASLRAFRDFMPKSTIYGADIDRNILFAEPRIRTGWVDQTKPETFDALTSGFGRSSFDLVIDDGLHSSEANLNTVDFWLKSGKPGGWVVIEDIPERTADVWRVVAGLITQAGHECWLVKAPFCYVFVSRHGAL